VSRPDARCFFSQDERDLLTEGALWARFDTERGAVGAMEAVLREDHLGAAAWASLEPTARRFVAGAEFAFREQRRDPAADLSAVVTGYGKALEVHINELLRSALHDAPAEARRARVDDRTRRIPDDGPIALGRLARVLGVGDESVLRDWRR
jgi:hypothetical protein